eukprot:155665-Prorocentrum_minimum.AAC.2
MVAKQTQELFGWTSAVDEWRCLRSDALQDERNIRGDRPGGGGGAQRLTHLRARHRIVGPDYKLVAPRACDIYLGRLALLANDDLSERETGLRQGVCHGPQPVGKHL